MESTDSSSDKNTLSADGRVLQFSSSLASPLIATAMNAVEALSSPFRLELSLLSESDDIDFADVLGKSTTVTAALPGQDKRYWNGIVTEFCETGQDDNFTYYEAVVEPSLTRLALRTDCRIFQDKKVDEILDDLLTGITTRKDYHHADDRKPHNYRVQYRETDFAFVSRLMEEAGIFYYFEHTSDSHTMVLCDDSTQLTAADGASPIVYRPTSGGFKDDPAIKSWRKAQSLAPTGIVARDVHFQAPRDAFESARNVTGTVSIGSATHKLPPDGAAAMLFEFPGGYAVRYDGVGTNEQNPETDHEATSNRRRDGELAVQRGCDLLAMAALSLGGTSEVVSIAPGRVFTLSKHFSADGDYVPTRVVHKLQVGSAASATDDASLHYENEFACWPKATPHRPTPRTSKPSVVGVQSAMVVADLTANEADPKKLKSQLYDKYGRVKVWFPWDRRPEQAAEGESPEGAVGPTNRSCWVRVSQFWAGAGWGAFFWPRHGNEVLVAFEHGDPDRPVIVGCVYNDQNMPPLAMPLQQDIVGIKSCSLQGNAASDFNGITFHDELDNEHVSIHSEAHTVSINEKSEHSYVFGSSVSVNGSLFGGLK